MTEAPATADWSALAANTTTDIIWMVDADGVCLYANQACCEFLEQPVGNMIGKSMVGNPDLLGRFPEKIVQLRQEVVRHHETRYLPHLAFTRPNGQVEYFDIALYPIPEAGHLGGMVGIGRYITEFTLLKHSTENDRHLLDNVLKNAPLMLWMLDTHGVFRLCTGQAMRAVGWVEVVGESVFELCADSLTMIAYLRQALNSPSMRWTAELNNHWFDFIASKSEDGLIVVANEVTARQMAEARIRQMAYFSPLTGLPNRSFFMEKLERRRGEGCGVLLFNLDHFRGFNETLGRLFGDQLLKVVAQRLKTRLPTSAEIAHLGGDEFVVVTHASLAQECGERLLESFQAPVRIDGQGYHCTLSCGYALSEPDISNEELLNRAEIATQVAKREGRNRLQLFLPVMAEKVKIDTRIYLALRRTLDEKLFDVRYEPLVRLKNRQVIGFEALTRWHRSALSEFNGGAIFRVAEETGLIIDLGNSIFRQVCRHLRGWLDVLGHKTAAPYISVNVSPVELVAPLFLKNLDESLARYQLSPSRLRLEVTESTTLSSPEQASRLLGSLRERGFKIALDDFGTGYSSLGHLHRLPIDMLKIDQSFVPKKDDDANVPILKTILALADNLGINALTEGIETEAQLALLRNFGCQYGQGYLFSRALPPGEALQYFIDGQGQTSGL